MRHSLTLFLISHLVHASDAEQAEELLLRWGPDGMGKIANPYWAQPIKNMLRDQARARAAVQANLPVKKTNSDVSDFDLQISPSNLHVVNGLSAFTSTTEGTSGHGPPSPVLTRMQKPGSRLPDSNMAKSNFVRVDEVSEPPPSSAVGTIRLKSSMEIISIPDDMPEIDNGNDQCSVRDSQLSSPLTISSSRGWLGTSAGMKLLSGYRLPSTFSEVIPASPLPPPSAFTQRNTVKISKALAETEQSFPPSRSKFDPSIITLDRAASAKIYFENLYFPILRKPPSREQRRLALERDLLQMGHLSEAAKNEIRERWRKNESDYLREKRQKVGPEAFSRLKVIGHGAFGIVTLVREKSSGQLYAMKQVSFTMKFIFADIGD